MTTRLRTGKRATPASLKLALGRALKQRRVAMGVSQAEIGARCRAGKAVIAHMERGFRAPSLGMLAQLSWALDVEVWQLFREAQEMMQEQAHGNA